MEEALEQWEFVASECDRKAEYEESRGKYGGVYRNQAELARKAAQSLRLEEETGLPHCCTCLKPNTDHAPGCRDDPKNRRGA